MAKIVKLKIPLIFFLEFCPSNNSRPVLMLIVTQEKRLGVNIWPIIGIIKPRSWPKLSGTYGTWTDATLHRYLRDWVLAGWINACLAGAISS